MPRFRFTIRRMMVAVAIVAILLAAGIILAQRSAAYRDRAARHAFAEWLLDSEAKMRRATPLAGIEGPGAALLKTFPNDHDRTAAQAAYQAAMRAKYERAARYPWLPVARDPPEPE